MVLKGLGIERKLKLKNSSNKLLINPLLLIRHLSLGLKSYAEDLDHALYVSRQSFFFFFNKWHIRYYGHELKENLNNSWAL